MAACNNSQNEAENVKDEIQKSMGNNQKAGQCGQDMIATSSGGYSMSAKFNGKQWTATCMYNPYSASRIVGQLYDSGSEGVGLPFANKGNGWQVGDEFKLEPGYAADLFYDDEVGIYGGTSGKMTVTKVDEKWIEGTFSFTATSSSNPNAKVEVTDGFFRIPTTNNEE